MTAASESTRHIGAVAFLKLVLKQSMTQLPSHLRRPKFEAIMVALKGQAQQHTADMRESASAAGSAALQPPVQSPFVGATAREVKPEVSHCIVVCVRTQPELLRVNEHSISLRALEQVSTFSPAVLP